MYRRDESFADQRLDQFTSAAFGGQVDGGRWSFLATVQLAQPDRLSQVSDGVAEDENVLARCLEGNGGRFRPVGEQPDRAYRGRGEDGGPAARCFALIVKTDIAADDGRVERDAGFAHPFEAADDLAHDFGTLRIAEVETVGDGKRAGTDRANVAIGFGDGLFAALIGVGKAIARGAVGGDRECLLRAVDADERGVATGGLDGVTADFLVILFPDPAARGDVGAGHELEQIGDQIRAFGHVGQRRGRWHSDMGPVIERCIIG